MEIFGDEKAPVPKVAPLETGRLDAAQRIFDLSVIGKCKTNNNPNNELKLDIQGRDMPELFVVNSEGKLVYAQPQPMSVITMPRGHCARVVVELEKIKNTYTDAESVSENIKRSEDYLCLGIRKNSKIINALYIVETDKEHASAPVDMDSEEIVELVPLVNSKKLSEGCEIAEPNTVVPEDFIAVGETLDFSSVYRVNVHTITEPVVRIDGTNVYVNMRAPFVVNATPQGEITFYDDNKIEDNVGVHTISEPTTFNFSGAQIKQLSGFTDGTLSSLGKNFAHNLSKYKVRYSIDNANIVSAKLNNQFVRNYAGNFNRNHNGKILITNDGKLGVQLASVSWAKYVYCYQDYLKSQTQDDFLLLADSCMEIVNGYIMSSTQPLTTSSSMFDLNIDALLKTYGFQSPFSFWPYGGEDCTATHNGVTQKTSTSDRNFAFSPVTFSNESSESNSVSIYIKGAHNQFYLQNTHSLSLLSTDIDVTGVQDINVKQNKGIALQRLDSDLSTQIVAGDYICFQGDGELSVTVSPAGTISHLAPTCQMITTTLTEPQTITIDPVNYKYEPCDTGGYVIRFTTEGVTLSLD